MPPKQADDMTDKTHDSLHSVVRLYVLYMRRLTISLTRTTRNDVIADSVELLRDYSYRRLKRHGHWTTRVSNYLHGNSFDASSKTKAKPSQATLAELHRVGTELERMYPNVYGSVSKQLRLIFKSADVVQPTLTAVAAEMFKERDKITWGRIVSLFAVTSGFILDSAAQSHSELIPSIIKIFEEVIDQHVASWIIQKGGWNQLCHAFEPAEEATSMIKVSVFLITSAVVLLLAIIVYQVLSALF